MYKQVPGKCISILLDIHSGLASYVSLDRHTYTPASTYDTAEIYSSKFTPLSCSLCRTIYRDIEEEITL